MKDDTQIKVSAVITQIRWFGAHCVRFRQWVEPNGSTQCDLSKWISGRYCTATQQLMPGRWAPISAFDMDLNARIAEAWPKVSGLFAGMMLPPTPRQMKQASNDTPM